MEKNNVGEKAETENLDGEGAQATFGCLGVIAIIACLLVVGYWAYNNFNVLGKTEFPFAKIEAVSNRERNLAETNEKLKWRVEDLESQLQQQKNNFESYKANMESFKINQERLKQYIEICAQELKQCRSQRQN